MKVNSFIFNFKNKNSIIYLLSRFLIILLIIVIVDQVAGLGLSSIITKIPDGRYYKVFYTLNNNESEVLIVGSSRGERHFVSKMIQDSLGLSVWNGSRDTQHLPYIHCVVFSSIARYKPQLIIMNVEKDIFSEEMNFEAASLLDPFYNNKTVKKLYKDKQYFKSLAMNSNLIKFNSSYFYLLRPLVQKNQDGKKEDLGWEPLIGNFKGEKESEDEIMEYYSYDFDPESVELFENMVSEINKQNIKLLMVISPHFNKKYMNSSGLDYLKNISSTYSNIELLDYSLDPDLIYQEEYFKDNQHLNVPGAKFFTQKVISDLKKLDLF